MIDMIYVFFSTSYIVLVNYCIAVVSTVYHVECHNFDEQIHNIKYSTKFIIN